jgi:hypothetical protein
LAAAGMTAEAAATPAVQWTWEQQSAVVEQSSTQGRQAALAV